MSQQKLILPRLFIVSPCYNEEEVLPETISRLTAILKHLVRDNLIKSNSGMLFVDDGSRDNTWSIIHQYNKSNPFVCGLKLARNAGHQNALLAGLMAAKEEADIVISIDADLQDDLDVIRQFILEYSKGYDIVYGVRKSRETDTIFKRTTALAFYRLMEKMGVNVVYNHADYRLLSKRVLDNLDRFEEVNLFLRGLIPLIGYKSTNVFYDRQERFAGESKYPLKKMLSFAFEGITSFSVKPIRFITTIGFALSVLSVVMASYALVQKLIGNVISGWASIMISIWFIGGIQLISLGLIGEYVGKIYKETKRRPRYIVDERLSSFSSINGEEIKNRELVYHK
ncbi:glycosyltransferase family 2 protein [Paenibacillus sp. S-38]|uniref:glycosyltransferase family 2 protein n=1 Tax=Paenibacillus sp. S-38 TaxID=3416710 RepID=UPI003CEB81CA